MPNEHAGLQERLDYLRNLVRPYPMERQIAGLHNLETKALAKEDLLSVSVIRELRKELWPPDGIPPTQRPTARP
jgi:hypothetical protein